MVTTIVFDLDDTLYDEIEYCRSGFAYAAEFLANLPKTPSAEHIFDALWKQFTTGNRTKTFNAVLEEFGISYDNELIQKVVQIYRDHVPNITLPADSRDILLQLSNKYTLALLTDGFLPAQRLKVRALGIEQYFKCIVYTEQLGREFWKPSPVGFQKLLETLKARPENVVYVADNVQKDFIAPNKLGFLTIQIIRPARIHTSTLQQCDSAAMHIIYEIRQLPSLLDKS